MTQTESEKYLTNLCRRSFLSLWSYPNLFTDEGRIANKGSGRELCDLLVVFGDNVIIFSDKHCVCKDTGDASVDWPRWYRRAVSASFSQIYGAESWLRRFPNRIYLDANCTTPFPLKVPAGVETRFHRIAVTKGSLDPCQKFFGGKSLGSLRISTDPAAGTAGYFPFTVHVGEPGRQFVHVFDEYTLDVLFGELDTVSDFLAYLGKKERFLRGSGRVVSVDGDEQLLGIYLKKLNADGEHDIVFPDDIPSDVDFVHLQEGIWEEVSASPQLRAKKEADRISYAWDNLIEHFIRNASLPPVGLGIDSAHYAEGLELALRTMAAETRLSRRQLAAALIDVRARSGPRRAYARVLRSDTFPDTTYVFLAEPKPSQESYEDYRRYRVARLFAYCKVAPLKAPNARQVIGIAFDSVDPDRLDGSEDVVYLDVGERTPEMEQEAREVQQEFDILQDENIQQMRVRGWEYPDSPADALRIEEQSEQADRALSAQTRARERAKKKKRKEKMEKLSKTRNRRKK